MEITVQTCITLNISKLYEFIIYSWKFSENLGPLCIHMVKNRYKFYTVVPILRGHSNQTQPIAGGCFILQIKKHVPYHIKLDNSTFFQTQTYITEICYFENLPNLLLKSGLVGVGLNIAQNHTSSP